LSGFPCAPEELAGHRFYDAMTGPTWYINATAYGHEDFLDHYFQQMLEVNSNKPQLFTIFHLFISFFTFSGDGVLWIGP